MTLKCPKCGSGNIGPGGTNPKDGKKRYWCKDKDCRWHGVNAIGKEQDERQGIDEKASKALHRKISKARGVQRYVITAAQNATPINKPFLNALQLYCKVNDAQLVVIPYRYHNPTSIWSEKAKESDWWAPEVVPFLMAERTQVHKHVVILADIMTQPTATSPLSGFETMAGAQSAIIGHPKLELVTVPTPQSRLPKILTTTGAVTMKNYTPTKAGKKGDFHHTFGACVLEIGDSTFHLRQINAVHDGSFCDLNREYIPAGARGSEVTPRERAECRFRPAAALVMGDFHEEFADPAVVEATFGKGGILDFLRPQHLVWHDVHDFYSRNHHHKHEVFTNYAKHHSGAANVERALDKTFAKIDELSRPHIINVFVPSNHPDALARWVKEADPKTDPENAVFWARTFEVMCLSSKMTECGVSTIDPFEYWARQKLKCIKHSRFLGRDESLLIEGIEVGYHGDRGPNGARGSRNAFSKIGVKTVIGHSHSPGIRDGAYQTGTSSRLKLEYNSGPSSWLHTHCVIYANGKRSLINIIDGEWRA